MYFGSKSGNYPESYRSLPLAIIDAMIDAHVPRELHSLVGGGLSSTSSVLEFHAQQTGAEFSPDVWYLLGSRQVFARPEDQTAEGLRKTFDQEQLVQLIRLAFPACLGIAAADSNFAIEELRFLRNLIQLTPHDHKEDLNPWFRDLLKGETDSAVVFEKELKRTKHINQPQILKLLTLIAHSDGKPNELERDIVLKFGERLGFKTEDLKTLVAVVETDLHRQSVLCEAMVRAQHVVFDAMDMSGRAVALLNTSLVLGISDDQSRRSISESLAKQSTFTGSVELEEVFGTQHVGLLDKIQNTFTTDQLLKAKREIVAATAFALTIEDSLPSKQDKGKAKIRELAITYGFRTQYADEQLRKARETIKGCKGTVEEWDETKCSTCKRVGRFALKTQNTLQRKELQCLHCGQIGHFCRMPKCNQFTPSGGLVGLCPEHTPYGQQSSVKVEIADILQELETTPLVVVRSENRKEILEGLRERSVYQFEVLDGRFYPSGTLLKHLLDVEEKGNTCVILDFWSDDLIEPYQVEKFQTWIADFIERRNRLVLGLDSEDSLQRDKSPIPRRLSSSLSQSSGIGLAATVALGLVGAAILVPVGKRVLKQIGNTEDKTGPANSSEAEVPLLLPPPRKKIKKWKSFLLFLSEYNPLVRDECESLGVHLEEKSSTFEDYLSEFKKEPQDFVASLFRPSDLQALFVDYQSEKAPADFLLDQFTKWTDGEKIDLKIPPIPPALETPKHESPIRKLYQQLVDLDSEDALTLNLMQLDDYKQLRGTGEARFCEWVYTRLERRTLVASHRDLLRSCELSRLCRGLEENSSWEKCDPRTQFTLVLNALGVREPEVPADILRDSLSEIRAALHLGKESLEANPAELVQRCRIGMERLLQMLVMFHRDAGLEPIFTRVIKEGLHGFNQPNLKLDDKHITKVSSGHLNHLLHSTSQECAKSGGPTYLAKTNASQIWNTIAFNRTHSLIESLNKLLHTGLTEEERLKFQNEIPKKVVDFLKLDERWDIRLPNTVRFFRYYKNCHGKHYEGLTHDAKPIHFYEVIEDFELNQTYLFISATNPSAVDMVCIPVPAPLAKYR